MKGQILETQNGDGKAGIPDPIIEDCYHKAVAALKGTGRPGRLSQAHYQLGCYLLSIGKREGGNQEIERALCLIGVPNHFVVS
jgi:hypothetical protein